MHLLEEKSNVLYNGQFHSNDSALRSALLEKNGLVGLLSFAF